MLAYPVRLTSDDGTVLVTSPDFAELTTFGEDKADALLHAVDAFEEAIAARMAAKEDIPPPSRGRPLVHLPTQTSLKVLLYREMRRRGIQKAELARRLAWHAPQVDRLFDLNHASRLDQIDAAFHALGARIEVSVTEAA
ncbi:MAG: type II toxin-antitoxin system HicB family antitoxin [Kiloniellaceae bacterium]